MYRYEESAVCTAVSVLPLPLRQQETKALPSVADVCLYAFHTHSEQSIALLRIPVCHKNIYMLMTARDPE
jgi:hypothetical protein